MFCPSGLTRAGVFSFLFSCEVVKIETSIFTATVGQGCTKTSKDRLEKGSIVKQGIAFQIVK